MVIIPASVMSRSVSSEQTSSVQLSYQMSSSFDPVVGDQAYTLADHGSPSIVTRIFPVIEDIAEVSAVMAGSFRERCPPFYFVQ